MLAFMVVCSKLGPNMEKQVKLHASIHGCVQQAWAKHGKAGEVTC